MCRRIKPTLFALFSCLLSAAVLAEPETSLSNMYYPVAGNTAEQLWADVLAKSPVRQNTKRHVAYTSWHVNWHFWWLEKGGSCQISKVQTRLDIKYTLPRLKQSSSMPESVIARWEIYYVALIEHEQGHKDLGTKAANEIEQRISGMGSRANCNQLEQDANAIGKSVIDKYSRIEKEYDRSTNHGLNTGAVFP